MNDKESLIPPNPETALGRVLTSVIAKIAVLNLFDFFIGYERSPNIVRIFLSGKATKDQLQELVQLYEIPQTKDDEELAITADFYQTKFEEDQGSSWVIELNCAELGVEGEEEFVPTKVELDGDAEVGDNKSEKPEEPSKEKEEAKEDKMKCIDCGSIIDLKDIDFILEDVDGIVEDAKMVCPVCKSEFAISALLTKPGEESDLELGGPSDVPPKKPGDKPDDKDKNDTDTPSSEKPVGPEGPEKVGGTGKPPGDMQIRPESVKTSVADIVEAYYAGKLDLEKTLVALSEQKEEVKEEKDEIWKGSLVDFQSKLFGMAQELHLPFDKLDDLVKVLTDNDAVVMKSEGIEVNINKTIDAIVPFVEEYKEKAFEPDPTEPTPPEEVPSEEPLPAENTPGKPQTVGQVEPDLGMLDDVGESILPVSGGLKCSQCGEPLSPVEWASNTLCSKCVEDNNRQALKTESDDDGKDKEDKEDIKAAVTKAVRKFFS